MFSNSTLGEMWMAKWCHNCLKDKDGDCPILLDIYLDIPNPALIPGDDQLDLVCTEFVPLDYEFYRVVDLPEPVEQIPGQLEMEF